MPETEVSG